MINLGFDIEIFSIFELEQKIWADIAIGNAVEMNTNKTSLVEMYMHVLTCVW